MIWRWIGFAAILALILHSAVVGSTSAAEPSLVPPVVPPDDRLPVPDKLSLEKSRELLGEVFKEDYARITQPDSKSKLPHLKSLLIDKLIKQSETTSDDPASSYAMLQEASQLAVEAGDAQRVEQCASMLAARFRLDRFELLTANFERMVAIAHSTESNRSSVEVILVPLDSALEAHRFGLASRLAEACLSAARKSKDGTALKRASAAAARATAMRKSWEIKESAAAKLATSPDDPKANLAMGQYLCFVEGNLKAGLAHLAKGDDDALKELAASSVHHPEAAEALNEIAEMWWAAAEKAKGLDKANRKFVAACFYAEALPGLTGLTKLKAQQRVAELGSAKGGRERPEKQATGLTGEPASVFRKEKPEAGKDPGLNKFPKWFRQNGVVPSG